MIRQYEMRDVRTNSIVNEEDIDNSTTDFTLIRNEIVDIFLDASLNDDKIIDEHICPFTVKDFPEQPGKLNSMKIPDLRSILRYYKDEISFKSSPIYSATNMKRIKLIYDFALNGTKQKMIDRIENFFKMNRKIVSIQKVIRGHFVRKNLSLRGPALKNRSICVNQTDFYTMEPLEEIVFDQFFSYSQETPSGNYVYGFDHNSLLELLKTRPYKLLNPYNREDISRIIEVIRKLERLNKIILDSQQKPFYIASTQKIEKKAKPKPKTRVRESPLPQVSQFVDESIQTIQGNQLLIPQTYPMSTLRANLGSEASNYNITEMINKIRAIRVMPFRERAQNLFMEIDQLGNYTQVSWFTDLNRREYMRYFRLLHDIWSYRAQMSNEVKRKICPMWDPFSNFTNDIVRFNVLTDDEIRCLCLRTMEDIIFTGIDREYRILGTFHALSALTIVSLPARNNMIWLYESLMY